MAAAGCMAAQEVESYLQALHLEGAGAGGDQGPQQLNAAWVKEVRAELQANV